MILFIVKWLLYAGALMVVSHLVSGITIASYGSAVLAAVVIALLDLVLGSILKLLTLPLTIITLGLFLIVINALLFWAAGSMLSGFQVAGFWTAVIGAILYSLLYMLVDALLRRAA